jgi:streptomycin 3"-adenylyltransferase
MHDQVTDPSPQLAAIVSLVRELLGDDALGAYLHGSAVLGTLRPHSDTDVLVVTRRRLTEAERAALTTALMRISGRHAEGGPARPIELVVVVHAEVQPWRHPPRCDLLYGEWLRDTYDRGEPATAEPHAPDLAPLLTMVLQGNRPLFGPPPSALLDPVPPEDLRRAIVAGIPGLLADLETDTANVLLTFARIWTTLATGAVRAKDQAADWALDRLSPAAQPALRHARSIYVDGLPDAWPGEAEAVRATANAMLSAIRALEPSAPIPRPTDPDRPPERSPSTRC